MFSPEEVASRPRRWCIACLARSEQVEAVAVERGEGFGALRLLGLRAARGGPREAARDRV